VQTERQEASAILVTAMGVYREGPVLPALHEHFSSVWFHHKDAGHPKSTAVVPDTCADLVWCRGRLLVAGPDRKVSYEQVPPGTTVVGLQFRPGAVRNWLRTPASGIVGSRVPLDCFWSGKVQELLETMGDATDPHVLAQRLQRGLGRMAPGIELPDRSTNRILSAVRHARNTNEPIVRVLTRTLGTTERTLRRHCEREFGYGAKTLDRIIRIQGFLKLAVTHPALDLTSLSGAAGYADQAHLTREARRLTGLTPKVILSQIAQSASAASRA